MTTGTVLGLELRLATNYIQQYDLQLHPPIRRIFGKLHGPTPCEEPPFQIGDCQLPVHAVLQAGEVQYGRTVVWVILGITCDLEREPPIPRHGDEGESTLTEKHFGFDVLGMHRIVVDWVVGLAILASCMSYGGGVSYILRNG
jgi:hypothetical protein